MKTSQEPITESGSADVAGGLRAGRYRFTFDVLDSLALTDANTTFPGATLRGALGSALRRTVCITGAPTCEGCTLRPECAYGFVFETVLAPGTKAAARYRNPPRPFVLHLLEPARTAYAPGEQLRFDVLLLGRAAAYLPHLVYALRSLERSGLGAGGQRGRVRLAAVEAVRPDGDVPLLGDDGALARPAPPLLPLWKLAGGTAPPATEEIELSLVTPLRLMHDGAWIDEESFALHHLVEALGRRLRVLGQCYGAHPPTADFDALTERARQMHTTPRDLHWTGARRYAARQGRSIRMSGLVGRVRCKGDLAPLRPLLAAGQLVHAGKKTTRGLGQYALRVLA